VIRFDAVEQASCDFRGDQVMYMDGSDVKLEVIRKFNHRFKQM
jgi:hypothetical protein